MLSNVFVEEFVVTSSIFGNGLCTWDHSSCAVERRTVLREDVVTEIVTIFVDT
jgi:hypothetical protein